MKYYFLFPIQCFIFIFLIIMNVNLYHQIDDLINTNISKTNTQMIIENIKTDLKFLGLEDDKKLNKISNSIRHASNITGIHEIIISTLMFTESSFNLNSVSEKGYKGLMQTPIADWDYDLDTIRGAIILKEKLRYSKGDLFLALALYKGGNNPEAKRYSEKTLLLINDVIKNRINQT